MLQHKGLQELSLEQSKATELAGIGWSCLLAGTVLGTVRGHPSGGVLLSIRESVKLLIVVGVLRDVRASSTLADSSLTLGTLNELDLAVKDRKQAEHLVDALLVVGLI